jgi:predicted amidohydrolase YtcJ
MRFAAFVLAAAAWAQSADTVLVNAKILTVDPKFSVREALAIREGKIAAVGTSAEMRKLAGRETRVIDLQGRTVIPGLIDSHLHAIRAALSFSTEVNWIGTRSLGEALGRITEAAHTMKPGAWLIVAGGWAASQFKEKRAPTQAELTAAAPNNPVYVQLGYGWAMITPVGYKTLGISSETDLPPGGKFERDASGKQTGAVSGAQEAIIAMFDKLPRPTFDDQVEGTKKFFREMNRLALTGAVDPGGNNMTPDSYQAVYKVWRDGQMTVRIAYALCGFTPGQEFDEYKSLLRMMPMGFGDEMLRFNGVGERITWAMNNNNNPNETDSERFYQIVKWAADHGMSVTVHWPSDKSVHYLLDIFERVNKETPIALLRWSVAHLNDASEVSLKRMKALNVGWTVQISGNRVPEMMLANTVGVAIGGGTDAHRVASYNPFEALQWFVEGKNSKEPPSRDEALKFYTLGSAWFSKDEARRGSLEVGKLADLAVLSKDYSTVPVAEIGGIESLLTMVGGKVVYAAGPFASVR